jgi:hypothetical protein
MTACGPIVGSERFSMRVCNIQGFGGLMLGASQDALRLSRPTVPERTGGLRFRGLDYLGGSLTYELTNTTMTFTPSPASTGSVATAKLCVTEASGKVHQLPATLVTESVSFPAGLGPCVGEM